MIAELAFDVLVEDMEKTDLAPLPQFIQATPTGLLMAKDLTFEEWSAIGRSFGVGMQRAVWAIGDWLVYGEDKFEKQLALPGFSAPRERVSRDAYDVAIKETRMNLQTLRDIASVCRRIPQSKRVEGLSFDHHRAIATAPIDKQDSWFQIVAPLSQPPSAKRLRLSIRIADGDPRIVTDSEIEKRGEQAGHDNYVPHLTALLTILRKTLSGMDEDQREALREDTAQLLEILESL